MIRISKIKWKNFLSTGNTFTELPLDQHNHTLIVGENGSGKSTLLDAICFALFNRPFRKINKPSLINSINGKECVVECEFSVGEVVYRVVRGIKPAIFEIYQDGSLLNQEAESRDYQDYLESSILKMNFKSFTQIAVLGSASFTPFMQLSSADRRAIIEDLLDIQIFSTMNGLLKEQVSANKESLTTNKILIESAHEKVDLQKKHVATLTQNQDQVLQSLHRDHELHLDKIAEYERNIVQSMSEIESLTEKLSDTTDLRQRITKLHKLEAQIQSALSKQKKSLSFFEQNESCPTCQQSIEHSFRQQQITELQKKIVDSVDGVKRLEDKIASVESSLHLAEEGEQAIRALHDNVSSWKVSIEQIQSFVDGLEKKMTAHRTSDSTLQDEQTQLASYEQSVVDLEHQRQDLLTQKQYFEAASLLLKDTGIKTKIVQQYLPIINTVVNKYLLALDFSVNFMLDESFNETIKSRYRDEFQYASFSEGEKQRIDMALMLTWRAVAKLKNSMNTNLLILDEVFDSSLDTTGAEELLKILTVLEGTNVFVISHRGDVLQDKFQHVIRFRKLHNFSQVML